MRKPRRKASSPAPATAIPAVSQRLLGDIRALIGTARSKVAQTVNADLVMLYWQIGTRVRGEILGEKRADYGKQIESVRNP